MRLTLAWQRLEDDRDRENVTGEYLSRINIWTVTTPLGKLLILQTKINNADGSSAGTLPYQILWEGHVVLKGIMNENKAKEIAEDWYTRGAVQIKEQVVAAEKAEAQAKVESDAALAVEAAKNTPVENELPPVDSVPPADDVQTSSSTVPEDNPAPVVADQSIPEQTQTTDSGEQPGNS